MAAGGRRVKTTENKYIGPDDVIGLIHVEQKFVSYNANFFVITTYCTLHMTVKNYEKILDPRGYIITKENITLFVI